MDGETYTIQMLYRPTYFRSIIVKPYYQDEFNKPLYTNIPNNKQEDFQDRFGKYPDDNYQPEEDQPEE
jgi:hypothetical protein